jgi:hypothetical protein
MTTSMVRNDALPDNHNWRDEGCEVSPSCLSCPLPQCRYDVPGGIRSVLSGARKREIVQLRAAGVPVAMVAARVGVSRRTVFQLSRSRPSQNEAQRLRAKGLRTAEIAARIGKSERHTRRLIGVRQYPTPETVRQYRAGHSISATVAYFGVGRTTIMRLQRGKR